MPAYYKAKRRAGYSSRKSVRSTSRSRSRSSRASKKRSAGTGYRTPSRNNRRRQTAKKTQGEFPEMVRASAPSTEGPSYATELQGWKDPIFPPPVMSTSVKMGGMDRSGDMMAIGKNFALSAIGIGIFVVVVLGIPAITSKISAFMNTSKPDGDSSTAQQAGPPENARQPEPAPVEFDPKSASPSVATSEAGSNGN